VTEGMHTDPRKLVTKSVTTARLEVSYVEAGSATDPVLLLLHGWPDDATTWDAVTPTLNAAGFRTITPMLRGFGATRFRSATARRTGNAAIHAVDMLEMLDLLKVQSFLVAGHDWGSNIAELLACAAPARVPRIAMLSTPSRVGGLKTPPFWHARLQWYHWFQSTKRGVEAVRGDPIDFARIMWDTWSPKGWFDEATFERVSQSFRNPDWVDVTIHSYQSRWGEADIDADSQWLDTKLAGAARLETPALYIQGAEDGVNPPACSEKMHEKFGSDFRREVLPGVGHVPTREAPKRVAALLLEHFRQPAS
jgi:pimeloyl-ACP methyl ester carboxylesterase